MKNNLVIENLNFFKKLKKENKKKKKTKEKEKKKKRMIVKIVKIYLGLSFVLLWAVWGPFIFG